jgi:UDP-N-acetylglucosamine--N-acetylmuramyl-(pentapeptide) pyrophosphoryl-undecaprenol N-acetylglucosamine transferase
MLRIVVSTGGTGGHVFAGVAVAEAFKRAGAEVIVTYPTGDRAEKFLQQEKASERFELIPLPGSSAGHRSGLGAIIAQARETARLFRRKPPSALVVAGGYSVVGPGLAALFTKVPLFVYEQNAVAGRANRLLSFWAKRILVNLPTHRLLPSQVVVGHPMRQRLLDAARGTQPPGGGLRHLLIVGGSQGARNLDETVAALYPLINKRFPNWRVMHLTGPDFAEKAGTAYKAVWGEPMPPDGVFGFRSDMETLYNIADAAISRAGAMASAELSLFTVPTIFVPYPYAAANHQTANAEYFGERHAAMVVDEGPCFKERLWGMLIGLLSEDEVRQTLRLRIKEVSPANDGTLLVQAVLTALGINGRS